jgi:hypothetical protein
MTRASVSAVTATPAPFARCLAVALPLMFCLWQLQGLSLAGARVSAPALKLSVRVVAVCLVSAIALVSSIERFNNKLDNSCSKRGDSSLPEPATAGGNALFDAVEYEFRVALVYANAWRMHDLRRVYRGSPHASVRSLYPRGPAGVLALHHQRPAVLSKEDLALDALLTEALAEHMPPVDVTHKRTGSQSSWASSGSASDSCADRTMDEIADTLMEEVSGTATPTLRSATTPTLRYAYRHDPYTYRGFHRLDVAHDSATVGLRIVPRGGKVTDTTTADVPIGIVLKPQLVAVDLRPRGRSAVAPVTTDAAVGKPAHGKNPSPPKSTAATSVDEGSAPKARNPLAGARKAIKKLYESSGMDLSEPLFPVMMAGADAAACAFEPHASRAQLDALVAATLADPDAAAVFADGNATLTGLPNVDGHRVAQAILDEFEARGYIDAGFAFANDARRTDRFNTGACHINFDSADDALRVQVALRVAPLFAAFRDGACIVAGSRG